MTKTKIFLCFVTALLLSTSAVHADSTVSVHGTVTAIPCTLTPNGQGITVDFGTVLTTRIDGETYKKNQVVLDVQCDNMEMGTLLNIAISGEPASFGSDYLATDITGLGMKFIDGKANEIIPVNTGAQTYYYHSNVNAGLFVVPVKDPSVELPGGAFMGTATLTIDYP